MLDYYQTRVPKKYREYKTTVFLSVAATCSIAILSCEYTNLDCRSDSACHQAARCIERIRLDADSLKPARAHQT
jgi:hypothetical protein